MSCLLLILQSTTVWLSICDLSEIWLRYLLASMASILRIFVSPSVCISCWTRCILIECRKGPLLGDSFSPRKMEFFPGISLQMHIEALQAFVTKRILRCPSDVYFLPFSAYAGTSSNVLGPRPPLFHERHFFERALLISYWLSADFFEQKQWYTLSESLILSYLHCPLSRQLTAVVPSYKKFWQVFISYYKVQIMLTMQMSFAKYIPFANAGLSYDTVVSIKLQSINFFVTFGYE